MMTRPVDNEAGALSARSTSFERFAGACAILAGASGFLYAVAFVVLQNSLLSGLFLMLGGLLTSEGLRLRDHAGQLASLAPVVVGRGRRHGPLARARRRGDGGVPCGRTAGARGVDGARAPRPAPVGDRRPSRRWRRDDHVHRDAARRRKTPALPSSASSSTRRPTGCWRSSTGSCSVTGSKPSRQRR
jgi:hypothetical protein